jgi:Rps23 Pro-64 3,4-dihydroxylase Tpa1-like proline 4-hydroxylase
VKSQENLYIRNELAAYIYDKLSIAKDSLAKQWQDSISQIGYFYLDDLLPEDIALAIYTAFPRDGKSMILKKSLRELKFVAAQMNQHNLLLEEIIYAFQDDKIVKLIEEITKLKALQPDTLLYAGGISMMERGHFLNPHLDNSHDKAREHYRVLNLLYYVSPNWQLNHGGNLELWPNGPKRPQVTIENKVNRLVVMITKINSWHSVSPVLTNKLRCCVSNYYFSKHPAHDSEYFHVTSFRGRPEQKFRDLLLRADIKLRMAIRKLFPKGMVENKHFYNINK